MWLWSTSVQSEINFCFTRSIQFVCFLFMFTLPPLESQDYFQPFAYLFVNDVTGQDFSKVLATIVYGIVQVFVKIVAKFGC